MDLDIPEGMLLGDMGSAVLAELYRVADATRTAAPRMLTKILEAEANFVLRESRSSRGPATDREIIHFKLEWLRRFEQGGGNERRALGPS